MISEKNKQRISERLARIKALENEVNLILQVIIEAQDIDTERYGFNIETLEFEEIKKTNGAKKKRQSTG